MPPQSTFLAEKEPKHAPERVHSSLRKMLKDLHM